MKLQRTSRQHHESGSITLRMLWIAAVAAIVIAGFFALRMPQHEIGPAMAVAAATEPATQRPRATPDGITSHAVTASPARPDESIAQQQALDPVGAGNDVAH